ncbi:stage V sporulation protein AE [Brevibacillus centrosporus]|uniref:Stage V sporulation protein AE n=1 Tax=Brevibacillus centrosporus TaxID=54910 RepID=A0A1I3UAP3_9BACL|nr:stage V sporulation protein AE [Brevibacillus centrosporus]MEC2132690.1 stage V sporulation protein AE [Brevibacillus centrosporus]MED4908788.1 stage V sporulation protein AE [Brevibacillus centrosporus]RNB68357.1 stage V sporulation protein AE [Brevibacillus centrosporus]SFJ79975.1 stage V sporulation protein AE [Brevibacillus centrosporus]GED29485.1 stage V sporulation protein AE [Brevibacillus centrosporus]
MDQEPRKVILVTDGDHVAQKVVETVARELGGRCISLSSGNPTPLRGKQMVELIKMSPHDPVIVMFDDNGDFGQGRGEQAIEYVAKHPDIEVIGAIAVASNTRSVQGATVAYSVDNHGQIVEEAVDKDGYADQELKHRIYGDTVDILNSLQIQNVIGIGDIGKMEGKDSLSKGCPITRIAVQWILERSKVHDPSNGEASSHLREDR